MIGVTDADESDEVLAFIAERRGPVLRAAIDDLAAAPVDDLPDVTHRLHGILGSYGLDEAHEYIAALAELLADADVSAAQAQAARESTVVELRRLADEGGA
ncbi:MAG: hypothetical protein U0R65_02390 [Candidatus Nanopelagicales bacterium]